MIKVAQSPIATATTPNIGDGLALRIVIAGGGTGGHIFPAIAIANALKKIDDRIEILFIGAIGKMEMEKVPQAGYRIIGLPIAGFNRSSLLKNISLPFKIIKSFLAVRRIFNQFHPDKVIGVGGYSTFPVLKMAQRLHLPTYIHESNALAGKSNVLLGKKATTVFVARTGMEKYFPANKLIVSGNPVRTTIAQSTVTETEGKSFFGLRPAVTTLLVVGGSLGARGINEVILLLLPRLLQKGIQIIWQTGKVDAQKYQAATVPNKVWVGDFITEMDKAYAAADLIISRAGAMAIAELCVVGKPIILVPYPHAAEDHQTANAMDLVKANAAVLIPEADLAKKLFASIEALLSNPKEMEVMKAQLNQLAIKDADDIIAQEILKN